MTEDWEDSPDAARTASEPPARYEARVQLLFGERAEVVTEHHPADDPLRVPASELAAQLGVGLQELPGMRFTAEIAGEAVRNATLSG
jgi:hypothetical protein